MGFHEKTSTVFGVALVVVAVSGVFLPALHPMFNFLGGGRSAEDGGSLTGKFVGETLMDATLRNCEVRDGKLIRVQTYNCILINTEVVDSKVSGGRTDSSRSTLTEFKGGTIRASELDNVTLENAAVEGGALSSAIIRGGSLTDVALVNGQVEDAAISGGTFRGATLRSTLANQVAVAEGSAISLSQVENYTLRGGSATQSTLLNVRDEGADVRDCNVRQADLVARRVAREGGSLVATVANAGAASAYYFEVVFSVNGQEAGRALVKGVSAGTSVAVAVSAPSWASSGRLTVTVDAADRIPETNEGNNEAAA